MKQLYGNNSKEQVKPKRFIYTYWRLF